MCIVSLSFYSCPTFPASIKLGSFKDQVTFSFLPLALLFLCVLSTMSTLSFVVELDSFQHGEDNFVLKCLAVSCGCLWNTYFRLFDTTSLLSRGSVTLQTYQSQTRYHGLALASAGLPQAMACSILMHAILKDFMDLSERGDLVPALVIMWVKGTEKTFILFFTSPRGLELRWEECYGAIPKLLFTVSAFIYYFKFAFSVVVKILRIAHFPV